MQANYTLRLHLFLPFLFAALFVLRPVADQSEATRQGLRNIDKAWLLKLGSKTDKDALSYLKKEAPGLFGVKSEAEFLDGSTDGVHNISDLSKREFQTLSNFYRIYAERATSVNPDGSTRFANEALTKEREAIADYIAEHPGATANEAIGNIIPDTANAILDIPNTVKGAGNYLDAVLPTTNQERLDELYGSHTDGSVLQANIYYGDAISTAGMVAGGGTVIKAGAKGAIKALDGKVDEALEAPRLSPLDGTETTLEEVRSSISTAKSYQSAKPRTLSEQLAIEEVKANPEIGEPITNSRGEPLNNDPLFHKDDGFVKMQYKDHKQNNGKHIDIHYQYHPESGNIYDIKINSPKP